MSREPGRLRVVFDCNTLIHALAFPDRLSWKCVEAIESGKVSHFLSRSTLAELRRVLAYPEVLAISDRMTPQNIAEFITLIKYRSTMIRKPPHILHYERDPLDEPYIDLAAAARADYLVMSDKDLRSLMAGHSDVCKQFRRATHPLQVVTAHAFIDVLQSG